MQERLEEKVLQTICSYDLIKSGDRLVIGVSGGPDSICLLHILNKIRKDPKQDLTFDLVVCHINHMLRKEATQDEQFVENYCKNANIKCFVKQIDIKKVAKKEKIGLEEAGRKARYEFFTEILTKTKANKIVTAHHMDDHIETIIMHLIRGCSINGLQGMQAATKHYIRPLIACEKKEIEAYCKQEKLNPRIDQTNQETIYLRNKIRNQVIPYLEQELNPNIKQALNRLSVIAKEETDFLEKQVEIAYQNLKKEEKKGKEIILDLKKFNELELVIKRRVILYTINELFGTKQGIEKNHLDDVIKLCQNNIGNKFLVPNKKVKILVKNKKIYVIAKD